MINSQKIHISIAGLGTIGSNLINILEKDRKLIIKKKNEINLLSID